MPTVSASSSRRQLPFRLSRGGGKLIPILAGLVRNPPCSKARQLFASALQIVWREFCRRLLTGSPPTLSYTRLLRHRGYRVSIYSFLLRRTIAPGFHRHGTFARSLSLLSFFFSLSLSLSLSLFPAAKDTMESRGSFVAAFVKEIKGFDREECCVGKSGWSRDPRCARFTNSQLSYTCVSLNIRKPRREGRNEKERTEIRSIIAFVFDFTRARSSSLESLSSDVHWSLCQINGVRQRAQIRRSRGRYVITKIFSPRGNFNDLVSARFMIIIRRLVIDYETAGADVGSFLVTDD